MNCNFEASLGYIMNMKVFPFRFFFFSFSFFSVLKFSSYGSFTFLFKFIPRFFLKGIVNELACFNSWCTKLATDFVC